MAANTASTSSEPFRNHILRAVGSEDLQFITPHLERVTLTFRETLYEQRGPIDFVYFVESGVVSLVTELDEGGTIETGTIGNEGMVGVPAFL